MKYSLLQCLHLIQRCWFAGYGIAVSHWQQFCFIFSNNVWFYFIILYKYASVLSRMVVAFQRPVRAWVRSEALTPYAHEEKPYDKSQTCTVTAPLTCTAVENPHGTTHKITHTCKKGTRDLSINNNEEFWEHQKMFQGEKGKPSLPQEIYKK